MLDIIGKKKKEKGYALLPYMAINLCTPFCAFFFFLRQYCVHLRMISWTSGFVQLRAGGSFWHVGKRDRRTSPYGMKKIEKEMFEPCGENEGIICFLPGVVPYDRFALFCGYERVGYGKFEDGKKAQLPRETREEEEEVRTVTRDHRWGFGY